METIRLIEGGKHKDERGEVRFINDFHMDNVKRFYQISNSQINFARAWQAHKIEKKWFYAFQGNFEISVVEILDWDHLENSKKIKTFVLSEDSPAVLFVPEGNANSIKSLSENAKLQVFSNLSLEEAKEDQFKLPTNTW